MLNNKNTPNFDSFERGKNIDDWGPEDHEEQIGKLQDKSDSENNPPEELDQDTKDTVDQVAQGVPIQDEKAKEAKEQAMEDIKNDEDYGDNSGE